MSHFLRSDRVEGPNGSFVCACVDRRVIWDAPGATLAGLFHIHARECRSGRAARENPAPIRPQERSWRIDRDWSGSCADF